MRRRARGKRPGHQGILAESRAGEDSNDLLGRLNSTLSQSKGCPISLCVLEDNWHGFTILIIPIFTTDRGQSLYRTNESNAIFCPGRILQWLSAPFAPLAKRKNCASSNRNFDLGTSRIVVVNVNIVDNPGIWRNQRICPFNIIEPMKNAMLTI